jgi:hypothetical protein
MKVLDASAGSWAKAASAAWAAAKTDVWLMARFLVYVSRLRREGFSGSLESVKPAAAAKC